MAVQKISITGTKGKTTVTNVLAEVLLKLGVPHVLHVNTLGHFINGKQKSDFLFSNRIWGLVPTVAPGKYLYELKDVSDEDCVAVLECSLGCSALSGLGYAAHTVGVFLNVFEDHLGSSKRLKTKDDILKAKQFVYERLARNGWAVCNTDDAYVVRALDAIPPDLNIRTITFGISVTPDCIDAYAHVTVQDGVVTYVKNGEKFPVVALEDISWTFSGLYIPSIYNVLAVIAAVIAYRQGEIPNNLGEILSHIKLDPYGGRLTLLKNEAGVQILADYAHEKKSLVEVAKLARDLTEPGGKVFGIVRLAYDRTDQLIDETGRHIAPVYDYLIVYDKIDGHWKMPKENLRSSNFKQVIGYVSERLSQAIKTVNPNCERIIREDQAVMRAAELAQPGDVVIFIVNDNISRSIGFIKEFFKADFA